MRVRKFIIWGREREKREEDNVNHNKKERWWKGTKILLFTKREYKRKGNKRKREWNKSSWERERRVKERMKQREREKVCNL